MKTKVLLAALIAAGALAQACDGDEDVPISPTIPTDGGDASDATIDAGDASKDATEDDAGEIGVLDPSELAPGGATTTDGVGMGAFTARAANLSIERRAAFEAGLQFFQLPWVVAPGRADTDGLGPTFNANSCLGCHTRNSRGSIDTILLRIGLGPEASPVPSYGVQLQPFGIPGVPGEGLPVRALTEETFTRADGTTLLLVRPSYTIDTPNFGPLGDDLRISPRIAPAIIGQGLLEAIGDADLVANEDPTDANGDGISGVARRLTIDGVARIGRFGWKAGLPSVRAQTATAFSEDLGITSSLLPTPNCPPGQDACASAPNGGDPELIERRLDVTVEYVQLLGVPKRRDGDAPDVLRGKALFAKIGCAGCHTPSFTTSAQATPPELANQRIWPYTDLLLHDMGERLSDRRREGTAEEREWRTPPLWGLGLYPVTSGAMHLLHDGRASSVDEAIAWHDGEAKASRLTYERLSAEEREHLRKFVESL